MSATGIYRVAGGGWPLGNIMPATNFSFDGAHVFLTYPQCPLERECLRDFLVGTHGAIKFLVARESHSDGSYHLHAYAHFGRRLRCTGTDCFDLEGYHPNIQKPRSAKAVAAYCAKDDDSVLRNFEPDELETTRPGWKSLLQDCPDAATFLARVEEHYPRELCLSLARLLEFCEWRFGRDRIGYSGRSRGEFLETDQLRNWVSLSIEVGKSFICNALTATPAGSAS